MIEALETQPGESASAQRGKLDTASLTQDAEGARVEGELAVKGYFESVSGTEVIGWAVVGDATVCEVQVLVDEPLVRSRRKWQQVCYWMTRS